MRDSAITGMQLETDRLILRRWEYGDLVPFRAINGDSRVMEFYPSVPDATESDRILRAAEALFDEHGFGLFATEAARACLADGFTRLGLDEIVSMTAVINHRSRRVMEKLGMNRNPKDDFEHPKVAPGHVLRPHVLYRLLAKR